jgi:platelet-activating factor acetylhydrolase
MYNFIYSSSNILTAGNCHIPVVWNADIRQEGRKLPAIVFSHGLGASRFFYSTVCTELASHGFVVAAVEHR